MEERTASRWEPWRRRLSRVRAWGRRATPFAAGILVAFVALLLYNMLVPGPPRLTERDVNNVVAQAMASATPPPAFSSQVFQVIQPSLVLIQTQSPGKDGKVETSLGSGVIVTDAGDILTSLHVVNQATEIQVTFADGTESGATITGKQEANDIAVLRATRPPAQVVPATLGNPRAMRVGDEAYVVGNPFGLYSSMSAGIISGFDRTFRPPNSNQKLEGLIQVDAAVNPGNSGGPLLNRNGEVIGIVEGIVNPTGQDVFVGIGFAVPINVAASAAGSPLD